MLLKLATSARKGQQEVTDLLLMSQQELSRLEVIQRVGGKRLTQREAATLLKLSVRQVKRLLRAYRQRGAAALQSKRRGRRSNNHLPEGLVARVSQLLRSRYPDFGPTLAAEKLREQDGLRLSRESVRRLMTSLGLWQPRRARRAVVHGLRERRARGGELVQIDGSPHDWFEGRAPRATLLVFVDDATGRLMHLSFAEAETTFNYFAAVRSYIRQHGKPLAFYSDKFGVFRVNIPNALTGTGLTQFGRAMQELSIELIARTRRAKAESSGPTRPCKPARQRAAAARALLDGGGNRFVPASFATTLTLCHQSALGAGRTSYSLREKTLDRVLALIERRNIVEEPDHLYKGVVYQIEPIVRLHDARSARRSPRERLRPGRIEYKGRPLAYHVCASRREGRRKSRPRSARPAAR